MFIPPSYLITLTLALLPVPICLYIRASRNNRATTPSPQLLFYAAIDLLCHAFCCNDIIMCISPFLDPLIGFHDWWRSVVSCASEKQLDRPSTVYTPSYVIWCYPH
jgi:hypothetical protein